MEKRKSFADKAKKKTQVRTCPVCNEPIEVILMVRSVKREDGRGYKFSQEHVGLCKCNQKEVFA
jgi:hypothetical protein